MNCHVIKKKEFDDMLVVRIKGTYSMSVTLPAMGLESSMEDVLPFKIAHYFYLKLCHFLFSCDQSVTAPNSQDKQM